MRLLILIILFSGFVFGTGAVIKHFKSDFTVEPSLGIETDLPNSILSPAGDDHSFWLNLSNNVKYAHNYTVSINISNCTDSYFKLKYFDSEGNCNLNKKVFIESKSDNNSLIFIQSNTSTPSNDYRIDFNIVQEDFQYVI